MRFNDIIEAMANDGQALNREQKQMGLEQMWNDEVVLYGGMRSGSSKGDRTRLRYIIFDREMLDQGVDQEKAEVGFVDLFVMDEDRTIEGLVNIEIKPNMRRGGGRYGTKVIKALRATNPDLQIYDIQKKAFPFWRKVGVNMPKPLPKRPIGQAGFNDEPPPERPPVKIVDN